MLRRHDVLASGLKVDRDWWRAVKLVVLIVGALAAAWVVNDTLFWRGTAPARVGKIGPPLAGGV